MLAGICHSLCCVLALCGWEGIKRERERGKKKQQIGWDCLTLHGAVMCFKKLV
jgi:hypothetical protein